MYTLKDSNSIKSHHADLGDQQGQPSTGNNSASTFSRKRSSSTLSLPLLLGRYSNPEARLIRDNPKSDTFQDIREEQFLEEILDKMQLRCEAGFDGNKNEISGQSVSEHSSLMADSESNADHTPVAQDDEESDTGSQAYSSDYVDTSSNSSINVEYGTLMVSGPINGPDDISSLGSDINDIDELKQQLFENDLAKHNKEFAKMFDSEPN